eukprot:TRINITY_DN6503_c0_g1_i1.p1 TRINITY_DN6503_c0_g1~~TRINITY_DN6503_c0_g1_i1.p1  ORF type:complete len:340 (-),score=73.57 TRINITY_DN6503_c0_g1_i1:105-1124(-)
MSKQIFVLSFLLVLSLCVAAKLENNHEVILKEIQDGKGLASKPINAVSKDNAVGLPKQGVKTAAEAPPQIEALKRSLFAGLSTSIGAAVVLMLSSSPSATQMAFALSLAAGVMLTVSIVELFVPAFHSHGGWYQMLQATLCIVGGVLSFIALKHIVPEPDMSATGKKEDLEKSDDTESVGQIESQLEHKKRQWKLGVLLTLALTAHNFPEGLAVAVSSMSSDRLGFVVMAAIAIHNIPEGIAIAMPVLDATGSRWKAMGMATASGLAEPLGALVAVHCLPEEGLKGSIMDCLLCVVGGIMTSVAFVELLPEAMHLQRPWATGLGLIAGAMIMVGTHELA